MSGDGPEQPNRAERPPVPAPSGAARGVRGVVPEPDEPDDFAARAALGRARDAARAKGLYPGHSAGRRTPRGSAVERDTAPGSARDPELLGATIDHLTRGLGWNQPLSIGGVVGRWREVVGDQIADHCTPETFDEGNLVVRADSTTWATQIRLLQPQLERRLAEEVGEGVVTSIQVLAPGGPTWRKGPRSVKGRGPRDTYG